MNFNVNSSPVASLNLPPAKPHVNVIFCIPGREFTMNFLQSWTRLVIELNQRRISFLLSNTYSPVVYYARTSCLRGHVLRGVDQKPFDDGLSYDMLFWIDSDIVWEPSHFFKIYDQMMQNPSLDCLAGVYPMQDGMTSTIVEEWDEDYFAENGTFRFLPMQEVQQKEGLFKAFYVGFGFFAVRKATQDRFKYPFFQPIFHSLKGGAIYDFSSEDASWFYQAKEMGIQLWIDGSVRVGHEKMVIL